MMRTTKTLFPLSEAPTLAELPTTGSIDARTVNAAVELSSARHAVRRFVEAAQYAKAFQIELRRQTASSPAAPVEPLQQCFQRLFMEAMGYYHANLDVTMPSQVRGALVRLYGAYRGETTDINVLFVDLRLLSGCEAGQAASVAKAIDEAEQALIDMKIG